MGEHTVADEPSGTAQQDTGRDQQGGAPSVRRVHHCPVRGYCWQGQIRERATDFCMPFNSRPLSGEQPPRTYRPSSSCPYALTMVQMPTAMKPMPATHARYWGLT